MFDYINLFIDKLKGTKTQVYKIYKTKTISNVVDDSYYWFKPYFILLLSNLIFYFSKCQIKYKGIANVYFGNNDKTNQLLDDKVYILKTWNVKDSRIFNEFEYHVPKEFTKYVTETLLDKECNQKHIYFIKNKQKGILVKDIDNLNVKDFEINTRNECLQVNLIDKTDTDTQLSITEDVNLYVNVIHNHSNESLTLNNLCCVNGNLICSNSRHDIVNVFVISHDVVVSTYENICDISISNLISDINTEKETLQIIPEDNIVPEDRVSEDIVKDDNDHEDIVKDDNDHEDNVNEDNVNEDNVNDDNVNEDNVQEDNVNEDNVQEDNVQEDNVQEDNVHEDNVKEDIVHEDNVHEDKVYDIDSNNDSNNDINNYTVFLDNNKDVS